MVKLSPNGDFSMTARDVFWGVIGLIALLVILRAFGLL